MAATSPPADTHSYPDSLIDSFTQKNYNSGGVVAEETVKDARPVTVRLFHDEKHPSVLYAPIGGRPADS